MPASRAPRHLPESGVMGRGAFAVAAIACLGLLSPAQGFATSGAAPTQRVQAVGGPQALDIPAGPLATSLNALSRAAGLTLAVDPAQVAGKTAPALSGAFTPQQALERLLAGSGLVYRFTNADTVILEREVAQKDDDPLRLEPITVTGARTATPVSELAASVTILDGDDIAKQPSLAVSPLDGLKRVVPGIQFNDPAGFEPTFRGRVASFRVNGVDLRNRGIRDRSDFQDLAGDAFGRIEAVRGADATFGQGASGGAVNFLTPRPQRGPLQLESSVFLSFAPDGDGPDRVTERVRQSATGTVGDVDFYVAGGFTAFGSKFDAEGDPLPDDTGVTKRNAKEFDFNTTVAHGISATKSIETSHYVVHNFQDERTFRTVFDGQGAFGIKSTILKDPETVDTSGTRTLYVGTIDYADSDLLGNALSIKLFGNVQDRDDFVQSLRTDRQNRKAGLNATVETPLSFFDATLFDGARVEWGADYEYAWSSAFEFDGATSGAALTTHNVAPLAQFRIPVSEYFLLSAGARYDKFFAKLDDASDRAFGFADFRGGDFSYEEPLFNASLIYFASDEVELYGSFSQALDVLELQAAANFVADASFIEPEPAATDQFEIGVRGDWPRFKGSIAGFFSESDNASGFQVVPAANPLGEIAAPLREPRRLWGVEATADWRATDWLTVGGLLAWTEGVRENDEGDTVKLRQTDITPLTIAPYVEVQPAESWLIRLQATHQVSTGARREIFNNRDGFATSSKTFVDLYAHYDSTWGKFSLGVENLFDEFAFSDLAEHRNFNRSIPFEGRRIALKYGLEW